MAAGRPAPDVRQQEAIDCNTNAVVSAGAGSGKTFVLTERFFRLVTEGLADVDQILTLTFTRKAAAEMFERIYRRLLKGKEAETAGPRRRELLTAQIAKFDEAQISTLDSFCSQIARTGAGLFGISPDFSVDNAGAARLTERAALDFMLRNSGNRVLDRFIVEFGFERVLYSFFTAYGTTQIDCAEPKDFSRIAAKQREMLVNRLRHHLKAFTESADRILGLDPSESKVIANNQTALAGLPELQQAAGDGNYQGVIDESGKCKLTKAGTGKSTKEALLLLKEYVDECREHQQYLPQIAATLREWPEQEAMFTLLQEFQTEVIEGKRRSGLLTYQDVLQLAIATLKKDREIRNHYKSMFRYIMIDEFQDNNGQQKELLYMLAEKPGLFGESPGASDLEPGKLFFVGDDKQSIYRFRGAEVSVFKGLCDELSGEAGLHIEMDRNYRSSAGLIGFFNRMFQQVFAAGEGTEEERPAYEADFAPLQPGSVGQQREAEITVLYKPYNEEEDRRLYADGDETEAYYIASYIQKQVENRSLFIGAGDKRRPAEYSDFALLMRSTSNQAVYEGIFRQRGIPYATDNVRTLFLEAPFNDIYNLLQPALFPSDRAACAAYLRSPLVRCSDETVFRLIRHEGPVFSGDEAAFLEAAGGDALSAAEILRCRRARELYETIRVNINVWSVAELVQYIWYDAGYRYCLLTNPAYHPYLEYFDYLYYLAMDADRKGKTIAEFLDFMRENLGKFERIDEIDMLSESGSGVQILTIHKSKGLEFPVVILANTGNVGTKGGGDELYFISPDYGPTFNVTAGSGKGGNYFYSLLKEEEKKKEIAETKRLFYVACTRAEDHLLISGYHHRNNRNRGEAMLNMCLQALGLPEDGTVSSDLIDFQIMRAPAKSAVLTRRTAPDRQRTAEKIEVYMKLPVRRFPTGRREYTVTEIAEHHAIAPDRLEVRELPAIPSDAFIGGETEAAALGSLTHYVMEQKLKGVFSWDDLPPSFLDPFPAEGLAVVRRDVEAMTDGFLASPLAEGFTGALRRETELDFLSRYEACGGDFFVRGRMDLYFESETEVFVVDFKTDTTWMPEVHAVQVSMYAKAAAEISGKPVRCYLFFFRNGEALELQVEPETTAPSLPDVGPGGAV